jgi:cysteine desulfurase
LATANYETDRAYIGGIKNYMMEQLRSHFRDVSFNGDPCGQSLYTVLNVSFPKTQRSDMLLMNLDINNICASGGSACTSGAGQGSHVIAAISGQPERVPVRFSFCKHNTREEVDQVVHTLQEIV